MTPSFVTGIYAAVMLACTPAVLLAQGVAHWAVNPAKSHLDFAVTVSGTQTTGHFTDWSAEIVFDPARPEAGQISVDVRSASATIDLAQAQGLLTQAQWLAADTYPEARFQSDRMTWQNGVLRVEGKLSLRGQTRPITLQGPLTIDRGHAVADVAGDIVRVDFGIASSPEAVAAKVTVSAHVEAALAP